jgi:capsular polysaccharide biosynthesis protein
MNFLQKPWWPPPSSSLLLDTESEFSGQYSEVYGQSANKLGLPTFIGVDAFSFMADPVDGFESIGVYELENATVCCSFGVVMDANSKIITQTSWNRVSPRDIRLPSPPEKLRTSRLTGVTAVIATESSDGNYGHFLLDSIGRIAIFKKYSPTFLNEIDHLLVSGPEKDWKKRLLLSFGVLPEKLVWIDDKQRYLCDTLLASSFPGAKRTYPFWLCEFFRQSKAGKNSVEKECTDKKRRLFFVRKGPSRKLKNSNALFALAERHGFEQYFPEDADDSRSDFRQAEAVVA